MPKLGQLFSIFSSCPYCSSIPEYRGPKTPKLRPSLNPRLTRRNRMPRRSQLPHERMAYAGCKHRSDALQHTDRYQLKNVGTLRSAYTFSMGVNRGQSPRRLSSATRSTFDAVSQRSLRVGSLAAGRAPQMVVRAGIHWRRRKALRAATWSIAVRRLPTGAYSSTRWMAILSRKREFGQKIWRIQLGDITHGETMTMAPVRQG